MRNRSVSSLRILIAMLFAAWLCVACGGGRVYDHYEQIPVNGWGKNDVMSFEIPPLRTNGLYDINLGLRTTGIYPFMSLSLVIQTEIVGRKTMTDTLLCHLVDLHGHAEGQGVSYYQYNFHLKTLQLNKGDSLHVSIHHNMMREMLPGISDMGICLSHQ